MAGSEGSSVASPSMRIGRHEDPAHEQEELRRQHQDQQGQQEAQEAGGGVVEAGCRPREVERQHAGALVAPEELRGLRRRRRGRRARR